MRDVLRQFIIEALEEMRNANVPQQLLSKDRGGKGKSQAEEEENEVEEMSTVGGSLGNGGGFTAPLGLSADDMKRSSTRAKR